MRNIVGLVSMPTEKITYKKGSGGAVYVYRTIRAYRNDKGKPTSDEVAIGKKDQDSGMLIPNANYFDYYPGSKPIHNPPQSSRDYGNSWALLQLSEAIGLTGILVKHFPSYWQELLTCAIYMACEGNVMMYVDDWCDLTDTPYGTVSDSKRSSELFASISRESRMRFFKSWISLRSEQEYLAYDVTSISTGASGISIAEYGHNRDGDNMPQINLGMYYGESSRLPVYYNVYNGSVVDKSSLEFMIKNTKSLGLIKIRFIMDRGFMSKSNLVFMHRNNMPFVIPMPMSLLNAMKIVDDSGTEVRSASYWIKEYGLYGCAYRFDIYGFAMYAHVFFSPERCSDDEISLHKRIENYTFELQKISTKNIPKKYNDFFTISYTKPGKAEFEIDKEKFDKHLRRAGYFVFITSDASLTPANLIALYKNRDVIEKCFYDLKNNLDFNRLRTHSDKTTEGKIFTGFLALILRSHIHMKLKVDKNTERFTIEKALLELKKIKVIGLADGSNITTVLTKTQKLIIDAFGLSEKWKSASH
jgi:transposase